MTRSFVFTARAAQDALDIWEYLAEEAGEATADRVLSKIYDECQKLGESPGIGHYREELLSKAFKFHSVWSYVIAYRHKPRPIQVIALVHGKRNLESFFRVRPA